MGKQVPPLRVAALVKQVPALEHMELDRAGRLVREGISTEMSAYCRRAVAEAVLLVEQFGGSVVVITMGPATAEDTLREAIAYGTDHEVAIGGVHLCDEAFAGSDTLATARALHAAVTRLEASGGRFDLVLAGRNSVDSDTGQVGPQLAELLDRPFATGVKRLELRTAEGHPWAPGALVAEVGCEHDDTWVESTLALPALVSTAERLIDPCKMKDPAVWARVDAGCIDRITASDLGPGPWGVRGSCTTVGEVRVESVERAGRILRGTITSQVATMVAHLAENGLLSGGASADRRCKPMSPLVVDPKARSGPVVVLVEPDRASLTAELLSGAVALASELGGGVVAIGPGPVDAGELTRGGATGLVEISGAESSEDVAAGVATWAGTVRPWAILAGSTAWGREVASRVAAGIGAGLTGDATGLAIEDGRLLAWKPAFGGSLVAAIRTASPVQMSTVRPGVLACLDPLDEAETRPIVPEVVVVEPRGRVRVRAAHRDDDLEVLATADAVIGVGQGVDPDRYGELEGLRAVLHAQFAATRKVTDRGWLPRARQLGITGRSIAPRLYVAVGLSGRYNHAVGVRSAGMIITINPDRDAPMFSVSDLGIVARWQEVVPELERQLVAHLDGRGAATRSTEPT